MNLVLFLRAFPLNALVIKSVTFSWNSEIEVCPII